MDAQVTMTGSVAFNFDCEVATGQMSPSEKVSAIARAIFEQGGIAKMAFTRDPISGEFSYGSILISPAEMQSINESVSQMESRAAVYE